MPEGHNFNGQHAWSCLLHSVPLGHWLWGEHTAIANWLLVGQIGNWGGGAETGWGQQPIPGTHWEFTGQQFGAVGAVHVGAQGTSASTPKNIKIMQKVLIFIPDGHNGIGIGGTEGAEQQPPFIHCWVGGQIEFVLQNEVATCPVGH